MYMYCKMTVLKVVGGGGLFNDIHDCGDYYNDIHTKFTLPPTQQHGNFYLNFSNKHY